MFHDPPPPKKAGMAAFLAVIRRMILAIFVGFNLYHAAPFASGRPPS